jgi:hypothetical protein
MALGMNERWPAGRRIPVFARRAPWVLEHGPAAAKWQHRGMTAGAADDAAAAEQQRHAVMARGRRDDGGGRMAHHSLIAARFRHPFAAWLDHTAANGHDHA